MTKADAIKIYGCREQALEEAAREVVIVAPDIVQTMIWKLGQAEESRGRLYNEVALLRNEVKEYNAKLDLVLDLLKNNQSEMSEIRKAQVKQVEVEARRAEACASVEALKEKYRTAKPTKLSDLVGLLNDYVEDEDQFRKDEHLDD